MYTRLYCEQTYKTYKSRPFQDFKSKNYCDLNLFSDYRIKNAKFENMGASNTGGTFALPP